MNRPLRILVLEDQRVDAELMAAELKAGGLVFDWRRVDTEDAFIEALSLPPDLILADYNLPEYSALAALDHLRRSELDIPFIIISGMIDEEMALETIALGATDYLFKNHLGRLRIAVERALAEKDLRERHLSLQRHFREEMEKYRQFIEGTEDLVVQCDPEGRYLFVNRMSEKYLGLPAEECLGRSAFEFVHPEDREATRRSFADWMESRVRHVTFSNRILSRKGDVFHLSWTVNLDYDDQGSILHLKAIAQDHTEQKRLQSRLQEALRTYESIVEASPAAIFAVSPDGTIMAWNSSAERVFGWTTEEVVGRPNPIVPPEKKEEFRDIMRQTLAGSGVFQKELVRRTRDGRTIDISISTAPLRDEEGRIRGVMAIIFDISEKKRTEAAHREAREILRLRNRAIEASSNGIMISEAKLPEMPIIYTNPAFEKITGYSADEVLGRSPWLLVGRDQRQPGLVEIRSALEEGGAARALVRNYREDGRLFWNELSVAPVRDAAGDVTHFVSIINDVTERKSYEEELERRSNFDHLTGLANRNLLSDRIRQGIAHARRAGKKMAILLLDLDRFQIINDSLGHSLGNELLKRVAERLDEEVRSQDTLARIGGDEFVIILQELKEIEGVITALEKIRASLLRPIEIGSRHLRITASIGISLFPDNGEDEETLIRNADIAMYHSKADGRDMFKFFTSEMDTRIIETMDLEADLRQAIEGEELILHFQPKVDVMSGRIVGSEALVRWRHPQRGMVSPGAFIPLAEETGLIEPIGEWVLREACRRNKGFQEEGLPRVTVAVNISARQFRNENFAEKIGEILHETGLEPRWLDLELTESMIMDHPEHAAAMMGRLKETGISLSLDDFGTGYSSLNYLRRFPFDSLKIDRSFIADVESDPGSASVANSIIDIAHNLGIKAVAEGVETEAQLGFLRRCGCDIFQGFLFSRPVPAEAFSELLRKRPPRG